MRHATFVVTMHVEGLAPIPVLTANERTGVEEAASKLERLRGFEVEGIGLIPGNATFRVWAIPGVVEALRNLDRALFAQKQARAAEKEGS